MQYSFLLNLIAALSALGSPANLPIKSDSGAAANGTVIAEVSYEDWLAGWPEALRTHHAEFLAKAFKSGARETVETRDLTKRTSMYRGKLYQIQGWVFSISWYLVEHWQGTNWVFPKDTDLAGQNYIADNFATDVRSVIGGGIVQRRNLGGGWSWSGEIYENNGYEFRDIPYAVMYHTCIEAIQGAVDWITPENGITWEMVDTLGRRIGGFSVYPSAFNAQMAPDYIHGEL